MTECEVPTEEYKLARTEDLKARHPKAHLSVVEHAESLEVLLDVSILSGFSLGVKKASIFVAKGKLLA